MSTKLIMLKASTASELVGRYVLIYWSTPPFNFGARHALRQAVGHTISWSPISSVWISIAKAIPVVAGVGIVRGIGTIRRRYWQRTWHSCSNTMRLIV